MIKKIITALIIILVLPIWCYAKVTVSDLYPTYKKYESVTKTISVPSKIIAADSLLKNAKTIALKLKQPRVAGIGVLLAVNGLIYCGEKVFDYVQEQSIDPVLHDRDGLLYKYERGEAIPPCTVASNVHYHVCVDSATCWNDCISSKPTDAYCGSPKSICGVGGCAYWNFGGQQHYYCVPPVNQQYQQTEVPASSNDIHQALDDGLNKADDDAEDITKTIVDQASTAYNDNPAVTGAKSLSGTDVADQVKTAVDDALDDAENYPSVVELTDEAANTSENDILDRAESDVDAADSDSGSIANFFKAVKAALISFFGDLSPVDVVEPTFSDPEKSNLTSILQSFTSSIRNLPIIATLNGVAISCSGSSNLCVELPDKYGGTRCYNGSNIQDTLNAIGTACLSIISLISFIYIFRG